MSSARHAGSNRGKNWDIFGLQQHNGHPDEDGRSNFELDCGWSLADSNRRRPCLPGCGNPSGEPRERPSEIENSASVRARMMRAPVPEPPVDGD